MKSYTQRRTLYGKWTKNTSSTNLTHGDEVMNDVTRKICSMRDFGWLHRTRTLSTEASTQFLSLPYDMEQVESVSVSVSGTLYVPKLIHSREEWDLLNLTSYTSDVPEYALVYNGQIGIWPTPATAGNTITTNGKIRVVDLSAADYVTGTITTTVVGDETVVGSSTSWNSSFAGRWLRITTTSGALGGDGRWYEISSITSATELELVRGYGGTAITAGSANYTIGEMSLLPEPFQDTPVAKAAADYWFMEGNVKRAQGFQNKYDTDIQILTTQYTGDVTDHVLDDGEGGFITNPNLTINL